MISLWFNKEDAFYFLSSLTSLNSLRMIVNPPFWTLCYLGFCDTTICFFSYASGSLKNNGFLICFTHIHVPYLFSAIIYHCSTLYSHGFNHHFECFWTSIDWVPIFAQHGLMPRITISCSALFPVHHICFLELISWLSPRPCKDSILHSDPCSMPLPFFLVNGNIIHPALAG